MKTVDFPAGHSMDTEWFAVDKDGNIAVFDSSDEGAVPIETWEEQLWIELFEKYTSPITPVLKQLYLDQKMIERLLEKCDVVTLKQILTEEHIAESCFLLLNHGKTWDDLNFEHIFVKKGHFALRLSLVIQFYLISNTYDIRQELKAAIKNGIIAKACYISLDFDKAKEHFWVVPELGISDLGIYVYELEMRGGMTIFPYEKTYTPEFPLKANQIAPNLADKIPHFKEISFENQDFVQPMSFFNCKTWYHDDDIENEKVQVLSSYDIEDYPFAKINDLLKLGKCKRCYPDGYSYWVRYYNLKAYQDYPPIFIIEDFDNRDFTRYSTLFNILYNCLKINFEDCVKTFCVKCYDPENEEKNQEFEFLRLVEKFQNCYQHLNIELSVLQPLLLIAIEDTVINLFKTKFEIIGFLETPCLCCIDIEGKQYPLLVVNNSKTKEEHEVLTKFLTEKSDEIKTILAQPRNLPPPKPRVIKIEGDEEEE